MQTLSLDQFSTEVIELTGDESLNLAGGTFTAKDAGYMVGYTAAFIIGGVLVAAYLIFVD
jgi:hypothetical protein